MISGNAKYNIQAHNVLAHELIGLNAKIVNAAHAGIKGMQGKIVNETQHTLELETVNGVKKIPKKEVTLELKLPNGECVQADGRLVHERPEDRIKTFVKKYQKYMKPGGMLNG